MGLTWTDIAGFAVLLLGIGSALLILRITIKRYDEEERRRERELMLWAGYPVEPVEELAEGWSAPVVTLAAHREKAKRDDARELAHR